VSAPRVAHPGALNDDTEPPFQEISFRSIENDSVI
jgi:hypothetical protein